MEPRNPIPSREEIELRFRALQNAILLIRLLIAALIIIPLYMYVSPRWQAFRLRQQAREEMASRLREERKLKEDYARLWKALPADSSALSEAEWQLIRYGKELVVNTAYYLGPKGSVKPISNGMNCQNCHLEAGNKPWGNNYGAVASTYPKYRARSGSIEDIPKRVNDCMERSLNGQALDLDSKEMKAFVAYIQFLGRDVKKGVKPPGAGIYELGLPEKALDTAAGHVVYLEKCASCHQRNGEGVKAPDGIVYTYPPLWGQNSYNQGAGLFRMSRFAGYVRYNMPQGASYLSPQISEEEAWNLAAFVNSQSRPSLDISSDWPKIEEKPFDHPFGPYKDSFSEAQHKYGPFGPIKEFYSHRTK